MLVSRIVHIEEYYLKLYIYVQNNNNQFRIQLEHIKIYGSMVEIKLLHV